jgi:hypothetical protein
VSQVFRCWLGSLWIRLIISSILLLGASLDRIQYSDEHVEQKDVADAKQVLSHLTIQVASDLISSPLSNLKASTQSLLLTWPMMTLVNGLDRRNTNSSKARTGRMRDRSLFRLLPLPTLRERELIGDANSDLRGF